MANGTSGEIEGVVVGRKEGRMLNDEMTLPDSTGIGIEDAAVVKLMYEIGLCDSRGTHGEP